MLKEKIKQHIQSNLANSDIKIFTNDDKHFNIIIISDLFKDKTLIERQRIIYDSIVQYIISGEVHAVSLKTSTNEEWIKEN